MNREELVKELREILPIMERMQRHMDNMEGIEQRIRVLDDKIKQPKKFTFITDMGFGIVLGFGISGSILESLLGNIFGGGLIYLIALGFGLVGAYYNKKIVYNLYEKSKSEFREELERRKKELEQAEQAMVDDIGPEWQKVLDIVPENYATPMCVNCIYKYLLNRRADSMKEAINLFEEEQHRWRVEENQQQMYEEYQREIQNMKDVQKQLEARVSDAEHQARVARNYADAARQGYYE